MKSFSSSLYSNTLSLSLSSSSNYSPSSFSSLNLVRFQFRTEPTNQPTIFYPSSFFFPTITSTSIAMFNSASNSNSGQNLDSTSKVEVDQADRSIVSKQNLEYEITAPFGEEMSEILFIQCGFGCDQHGQNPIKAAIRACRNAIEFNSIPSIRKLVPGGYENMKVKVILGVPEEYKDGLDFEEVLNVFPYGIKLPVEIKSGGLCAPSGIAVKSLCDQNDDMIVVIAHVTVGF